jgi:molybdate transport system substrate-binding protein
MLAIFLVPLLRLQAGQRTLNVFAAASLKEALTSIAHDFEIGHPSITVKLNFAGSQTLAAQINQGAPADVFASAAVKNLKDIHFSKSSYRVFASNKLDIALRKGLTGITSLADLDKVQNFVVADPSVPVGAYTYAFFKRAATKYGSQWVDTIYSHIVSREADVKAVLAKVNLGEADAGVVYVSDIKGDHGQVIELPIPDSFNQVAKYPVAIPRDAQDPQDAILFIKFLLEPSSQRTLEQRGFISVVQPPRKKRG